MGKLGKNPALCIQCGACEEKCSELYFKEKNRLKSSIQITAGPEKQAQITVCNQCGVCADICPVQAISKAANGVYRVDKKLCVGCFACVGFCPEAAMFHHDDLVEPFKCVACGVCVKACPTGAIFMVDQQKGG